MKAGLATVISCAKLFNRRAGSPSKPELSLGGAARKDDMGEFLDLLAYSRVGGLPHPRRTVSFATSDGDKDVFLRPIDFADDLAQLLEVDLELRRTMPESRTVIDDRRIRALPEPDQLVACAVEVVIVGMEL